MSGEVIDLRVQIDAERTQFTFDVPISERHVLGEERIRELKNLQRGFESADDAERYGRLLFESAFPGRAADGLRQARQIIKDDQNTLRLLLEITGDPALHGLWWECLCDPGSGAVLPLALSRATFICRLMRVHENLPNERTHQSKLRVLAVLADSRSEWRGQLDQHGDRRQDEELLREVLPDEWADVKILRAPISVGHLRSQLKSGGFHLLHLVARGGIDERGPFVWLDEPQGGSRQLRARELAQLTQHAPALGLVVLMVDRSAVLAHEDIQPGLVSALLQEVPAIIGMQGTMHKEAAELFTRTFYDALRQSQQSSIDFAVLEAREAISLDSLQEESRLSWPVPVLCLNGNPGFDHFLRQLAQGGVTPEGGRRGELVHDLPPDRGEDLREIAIATRSEYTWEQMALEEHSGIGDRARASRSQGPRWMKYLVSRHLRLRWGGEQD